MSTNPYDAQADAQTTDGTIGVTSPAKFWLLLAGLVGCFTLVIVGRAQWDDVDYIISGLTLYGLGNGVNAVRGRPTVPAIGRKPPPD